jgi:hypothetical protein
MKRYITKLGLLFLLIFAFASCEEWIDPEINVDPDSPADPSANVLLTAAQGRTAYTSGSFDVAGTTGMWLQQVTGSARQAAIINSYTFTESDVVNLWNFFYRDAMHNLVLVVEKASEEEEKSNWVSGIAKVLMSYNLGLATQIWGDVPYREGWQGVDNLNPVYDPQQQVYEDIQTLLDEAISELSSEMGPVNPSGGDIIYDGDPKLWLNAARALKARYTLHLSKRNDNAHSNALTLVEAALADDDWVDLEFPFGSGPTERNPLFQFHQQREDATESSFFTDVLNSYSFIAGTDTIIDPRASQLQGGVSAFGDFWGSPSSPVAFITEMELMFIKAESEFESVDEATALATLKDAVQATMDKLGVADADWKAEYDNYADGLSGEALLEEIMVQKYIALFLNPEAYVDWRRTGYPELTPVSGNQIPRRFPYSTEERLYNDNIPEVVSIFARNWFDPE